MAISLSNISQGGGLTPPKILLYSVPGFGKTTWVVGDRRIGIEGAPKPVTMFTEPGLGLLECDKLTPGNGEGYVISSYEEAMEWVNMLTTEDHDYETFFLDSASSFVSNCIYPSVCEAQKVDGLEDIGYGKWKVYSAEKMARFIQALDKLQAVRKMAVVISAHTEITKVEPPDGESYSRYSPALLDRIREPLIRWTDCVFFGNYEMFRQKHDEGFNRERAVAIGSGKRVMHTEERPAHVAKNRYHLPPTMEFSWASFSAALAEAQAKSNS